MTPRYLATSLSVTSVCCSFRYTSGSRADIFSSEMIPFEFSAMTLIVVRLWVATSVFTVWLSTYMVSWCLLVIFQGCNVRLVVMVRVGSWRRILSLVENSSYSGPGLCTEVIMSPISRSTSGWWPSAVLLFRSILVMVIMSDVSVKVRPHVLAVMLLLLPFELVIG